MSYLIFCSQGTTINSHGQKGISYIEVLVATVLVALLLIPAMESLMPAIQASAIHKQKVEEFYILKGKLESLLIEPFDDLDTAATNAGGYTIPTSYSNAAAAVPHNVYISRYDADNADGDNNVYTGTENDLLWIQVSSLDGGQMFQTLLSEY